MLDAGMLVAIGEAVRRHVDDAHNEWLRRDLEAT